MLAKIENLLLSQSQLEEAYTKAVDEGDKLMKAEKYKDALSSYNTALTYKPDEQYPKDKIAKINKILEGQNETDENYKKTISEADKLLIDKDYKEAKNSYQKAEKLKPEEQYPKDQINKIKDLLSSASEAETEYKKAIKEGDNNFKAEKYQDALNSYKAAISLKPDEKYPQEQTEKINQILAKLQDAEATYKNTITEADKYYDSKEYEKARADYQKASNQKPAEKYPIERIDDINKKLAELQGKMSTYNNMIKEADKLFQDKDYQNAKSKYEEASNLNTNDDYPKKQIKELDKIMAANEANQVLDDETILEADTLYKKNKFQEAISKYTEALGIKPDEKYPKNQIAAIQEKLIYVRNNDALYKESITTGDKFKNDNNYEKAIEMYKQALSYKPEEKYPEEKIEEIELILNKLKGEDENYKKLLKNADLLFNDKEYISAKMTYQDALKLRPDDEYPKGKIETIDKIYQRRTIKSTVIRRH